MSCAGARTALGEASISAQDQVAAAIDARAPAAEAEELRAEVAALRQRLRAAAHEIRTPLTGAATLVDILSASDLAAGPTADYLALLRDAVGQLVAIANDILDFGRLEADFGLGGLEVFSVLAVLRSVVGMAQAQAAGRGLDVALEATGLPDWVSGHPMMLRRVVENLVDNALKHTEHGGILVAAGFEQGVLDLVVRDSGAGIAPEDLGRLFEPYAQLASGRRAGGTGLGLALVRSAVERVGGRISVESEPGRGSAFRVHMPLRPAGPPPPAPAGHAASPRPLDVLVAEDNPVNRIVIGTLLREFGHRVAFSPDGLSALEALGRRRHDVVLMDIEMPGLDGPAALAAIRRLPGPAAAVPVVAVSARGEEGRVETLALGFDGYVAKPIEPKALYQALESARLPESAPPG